MDVATSIRDSLPQTDEIIVQYLDGLYADADEEYDSIMSTTKGMLESFATSEEKAAFQELMEKLGEYLSEQLDSKRASQSGGSGSGGLAKLDRVMEMSKTMSTTRAVMDGVDLSSVNKGK